MAEKMIGKLFAWIEKTFGKMELGDYMDLTTRLSKDKGCIITDIRITVNKKNFSMSNLSVIEARKEIDKISERSIHKLDFMSSDAFRFAPELAVKENKAERDALYGESAVMMKLNILHKRRIQNG